MSHIFRPLLFMVAAIVCMGLAGAVPASGEPLLSPFASAPSPLVNLRQPPGRCPAPPPPLRDLDVGGVHTQGYTMVDEARLKQQREMLLPLRRYRQAIAGLADRALVAPPASRKAAQACYEAWLLAWARGGAMLGNVSWPQGAYERRWMLTGLALGYLAAYAGEREAPPPPPEVADWFRRLASSISKENPDNAVAKNNHWYSAGVAAAATGVVLQDRALYGWGMEQYRLGVGSIVAGGFLPLELKRAGFALHYHMVSAAALVYLAAFAAANGEDPFAGDGRKLVDLVQLVAGGLVDPAPFAAKTGVGQVEYRGFETGLGWLEVYFALTGDGTVAPLLRTVRPVKSWLIGFDASTAFGQPLGNGPEARLAAFPLH